MTVKISADFPIKNKKNNKKKILNDVKLNKSIFYN